MTLTDADRVLIRAAANGDITADGPNYRWRGVLVEPSMHARLCALTAPGFEYLRVSDVATSDGQLLAPSGGGRTALR
jgi:hypothetical protein